jgi:trk system potassium uptake protein TrkA
VQGGKIDIALSPAHVTIGSLLAYVRQGDVAAVHSLRRGAAEALELVAHGDRLSSQVVGRRIDEIELPKGATIGAIVREARVMMGHHDSVIESEDHVIVFVINKQMIPKIEKLFQVNVGFF